MLGTTKESYPISVEEALQDFNTFVDDFVRHLKQEAAGFERMYLDGLIDDASALTVLEKMTNRVASYQPLTVRFDIS